MVDTAERKRAQDALRAWADIFGRSGWGFVVGDPGGDTMTLMNPAFARMHGYTTEELTGKPLASIFAPDIRAELPEHIRIANEQGHHAFESKHQRKDGTTFPVRVDVVAVKDGNGRVLFRTACVQDMTERKRTEEALRESEAILRATLEATEDGILVVDKSPRILHANVLFGEMWHLPKELLETGDVEKLRRAGADQLEDPEAFLSGLPELYETPHETLDLLSFKDGRVFERLSRPLMREGEVAGRVWSFRDVTERRRMEEALRASVERDVHMAETLGAAVFILHGTDLAYVNQAGQKMTGYSSNELQSMSFSEIVLPEDQEQVTEWLSSAEQQDRSPSPYRHRLLTKDGEVRWVEVSATGIYFDGKPAVVEFALDVTELERTEEALQRAREELAGKVERQLVRSNPHGLTLRELTLLHLVAAGRADKEIARELNISPLTVHKHVANILRKMNAVSRTEAGVRAVREGLLD